MLDTRFFSDEMRKQLLEWWQIHGRHDLPWKRGDVISLGASDLQGNTFELDPYPIWVAEVMLQQTQLNVMLPYWKRWMLELPTRADLIFACLDKILFLWKGLGYYSRARRLHQAAIQLGDEPWPRTLDAWMSLPGIGRTTAGSILSSAFNLPFPILDGNVTRVLARLQAFSMPPIKAKTLFWSWSEALLDREQPRDFNQALMDLGALICIPGKPQCFLCPWQEHCSAYSYGCQSKLPVKGKARESPYKVIGVGIVLNELGEVLIDQRHNEGLLGGLWEFPGGKQDPGETIQATISRELKEELDIEVEVGEELIVLNHSYSHMKLCFVVRLCRMIAGRPKPLASQQIRWVQPEDLDQYAFPAANAKIISALLEYFQDKNSIPIL